MSKQVRDYKFVTNDLKSKNGDCQWVLGEWKTCEGHLSLCENGLHASHTALDSLQYTYGNRWFMVEARGEFVEGDDKFCCREMRLTQELPIDKILVQFAILCARRCYKNYKKQYPNDKVVWAAILAAEKCLANPSPENLSAARSAERSAASAAWSAESEACAEWSAASAAWSAESATWSAESAARSAAWSAESAEWSAASAESAARSAARSAEKQWQQKTLNKLIKKYTTQQKAP